jgi:dipeptidase
MLSIKPVVKAVFFRTQLFIALIFISQLFFIIIPNPAFSCTMILAGQGTTADGSVLLAHNNDLPPTIASLIQIVEGGQHSKTDTLTLKNGLTIPQAPITYRMLMMNCYYGFSEGDAVAINQHMVAIAGGVSLKHDRNQRAKEADPLVKGGVSGHIRYIALQRSKTARECVEIIGEMYTKYGISYPSGVGVADPNEVWYIEAGGGKSWAAIKIPSDSYLVVANGYRIRHLDFKDQENYQFPACLETFVREKGLWRSEKGPFDFSRAFGGASEKGRHYNTRRVWRAQSLLTPSIKQRPDLDKYPLFLEPDRKINIKQLITILRDHYQDTLFDTYAIPSIPTELQKIQVKERAIGVFNTVHTDVIQLRLWMPPEVGAILWAGLGSAPATVYVPYYLGVNSLPKPYTTAGPEPDPGSAFWNFRALADKAVIKHPENIQKILPHLQKFETNLFFMQDTVEKIALALFKENRTQAKEFLTLYSRGLSLKALEIATQLAKN